MSINFPTLTASLERMTRSTLERVQTGASICMKDEAKPRR